MKAFSRIALLTLAVLLIPACFYDKFAGIKQDGATGEVTADVQNSPAAKVVKTVEVVADATPAGPIVRLIGEGLLALFGIAAEVRRRDWKKAAVATAQGVQNVVSRLDAVHAPTLQAAPSAVADLLKEAIDKEHDSHLVSQDVQNLLTPVT